jgi:hypothetical protein
MFRAQVRQYLSQDVNPTSGASVDIASYLSIDYALLGDRDNAFRWIETAIERHEDAPIHLLTDPGYDSLRSDPRFTRLLERLDLKQK